MDIQFTRDITRSYMVMTDIFCVGYELSMLQNNDIPGLFHVETIVADGNLQYWYDISGLQILDSYLESMQVNFELLKNIIIQIEDVCNLVREYMLLEDHICLRMDMIGLCPGNQRLKFCYVPSQEKPIQIQFREVMEQLLQKIDHQDSRAVETAYAIYERTLEDNYNLTSLIQCLDEVKKSNIQKQTCLCNDFRMDEEMIKEAIDYQHKNEEENTKDVIRNSKRRIKVDVISSNNHNESKEIRSNDYRKQENRNNEKNNHEINNFGSTLFNKLKIELGQSFFDVGNNRRKKNVRQKNSLNRYNEEMEKRPVHISFEPDEEEEIVNPTVLLNETEGIEGRLNYMGVHNEKDLIIQSDTFLIGTKAETVDGILESSAVSRIHARIQKIEEEYYLEDLNSKNGTWLDGELLNYREQRKLERNMRVRFADEEFRFC